MIVIKIQPDKVFSAMEADGIINRDMSDDTLISLYNDFVKQKLWELYVFGVNGENMCWRFGEHGRTFCSVQNTLAPASEV